MGGTYLGFVDDGDAVDEVGHDQGAVDGDLTFQKICEDDHILFALDAGDIGQDNSLGRDLVTVYGGQTHITASLLQGSQNGSQPQVALFKFADSGHDLLCGGSIAQLL